MSSFPASRFWPAFLLLLRGAEAADHIDVTGNDAMPLPEGFVVLEREHGCGGEDGRLAVSLYGLESCAHGHFRLAVADVTAEQPIHRLAGLHIPFDVRPMAIIWSSVSLYSKPLSNSFIHSVSLGKLWPCTIFR